jgi:cytochrome c oxidase cbb3-type subunit 2
MIDAAAKDAYAQATPDGAGADGLIERYGEATQVRVFDGDAARVTEMDALVAYLQILGKLTDVAYAKSEPAGE